MILHRFIGGLGRVLMSVGVLVLAFAAFQYWGTGLAESRAQNKLDGEFVARLAEVEDDADEAPDPRPDRDDGDVAPDPLPDEAADDPGPPEPSSGGVPSPMLDLDDIPAVGEAAGRIIIPAIDVDKTYVQGVGRDDLRKGPGHYPLSPFPGQPGNAAIAGHRTTYGAPFFDLDKLVPGDEIIVETLQGRFTYLVEEHRNPTGTGDPAGHFIVEPTATWVLHDQGDSRLTLTACHPKRSAAQRIVVTAILDSTPAVPTPVPAEPVLPDSDETESVDAGDSGDPTPVDDAAVDESQTLDETLGWQPEHWPATVLWAGVCGLLASAGWLLGRRWRRVPAYAATAGPLLACLFMCFTNLDKLLPAI